jgi:hypothetical protein
VGGRIIVNNNKNLGAERTWANPLNALQEAILCNILHLLFFPLVWIISALCLENRKKLSKWPWCGTLEFHFLRPRGCLTNPFRILSLCFGIIGKTPGLISHNNFVNDIFVCIGHRDNVLARCDSVFPLLRCQGVWNQTCTQLFPKSSFRVQRTTVVGMFQDAAILVEVIRRSFFIKSATSALFTSVRVDFGQPPLWSFSSSSLPSRNREYNLKTLDRFGAWFP